MRIALIVNRSGGSFRRLPLDATLSAVTAAFEEAGHQVQAEVSKPRDLPAALAAAAARADVDAVVVGGGDGTILSAVFAGIGRDKPLGVVPLGTLNLFARDLGLPLDPVEAARRIARGSVGGIDLAEVNGLPFVVWASLGLHPRMVRQRDRLQRGGLAKWPAFALAALRALRRFPNVGVTLTVKGESVSITTPLLVVSNNAWNEGVPPLSRRTLDRGEMEVHVAEVRSRWGLVPLAFNALMGRWKSSELLRSHVAEEVRVTSRKRRLLLSLDGEVTVLRSPLIFRSKPQGLKVLMPG